MTTDPNAERRGRRRHELLDAAQAGDRSAFDELVRRTYVDTYTLAMRLTANEEDARDVVQEAYLRAWKGIDRFRGDAQFSTWMYRITANTASTLVEQAPPAPDRAVLDDVDEPVETAPRRPARAGGGVGARPGRARPGGRGAAAQAARPSWC